MPSQTTRHRVTNCRWLASTWFQTKALHRDGIINVTIIHGNTPGQQKDGLIYSIDLSAVFDLLRPIKFFEIYKDRISEGLLFAIMDFLQERTSRVDLDGSKSDIKKLDRGCDYKHGPGMSTSYRLWSLSQDIGLWKPKMASDQNQVSWIMSTLLPTKTL